MNTIKVLYVDSDKTYGQQLLSSLLNNNYDIKYITTLNSALLEYTFFTPDILLVDVNLKDGNGFKLIEKIQKESPHVKIVILSQEIKHEDLLKAVPLKIEQFLLKNMSLTDTINKIKHIKLDKEIKQNNQEILQDSIDLGEHYFFSNDNIFGPDENIIKLTPQELALIKILIKQKGESVTYEMLQNSLSKDTTSLDTIRTVIRKIRKKTHTHIIQNQSGIGYKINFLHPTNILNAPLQDIQQINASVLIIKGNKKKNELLNYKLSKFGFNCESAFTIHQAKELVKTTNYNYIIIDLNLPDGESIDFIREFDELFHTRIIVLSNNKDIHYKDYLYFKGILDYIIDNKNIETLSNYIYKIILKVENNTKYNNILVVEQSKKTCEQIKDLLLPRGYEIDIINNLNQAKEVIKSKLYSLIIIDVNLEGCFEFILNVKSNISKSINFVVLTEENRNYSIVREAYINGASECLRKPIYAEEFLLKIDQLVDSTKLIYNLQEHKQLLTNYKKIVDQSAIISKTNSKGIITYVNKIFCDISGYSEKELIGKPHSIIRHPNTPKTVFEQMWYTIKHEKRIWTGVIKNKAKDGHPYYVQTSIMPILNKDGEVEEYIALRNDISSIYKDK